MINFDVDIQGFQDFTREATANLSSDDKLKTYRALALTFIGKVVPRTPVDTGQARGGWTAMPGSVKATIGSYGRMGPGAVEGRRKSSYAQFKSGTEAGVEITNGVPHITYLELGSSQQAPSGFVRLTLREMMPEVRNVTQRDTEAALRLANIKARRSIGLRQGLGSRNYGSRANLGRK